MLKSAWQSTPELLLGIFTDGVLCCILADAAVVAILVQSKEAQHIGHNDVVLLWVVVHQLLIVKLGDDQQGDITGGSGLRAGG